MLLDNTDLSSSSLDLLKANIPSWTLKIQARLLDVRSLLCPFSHGEPTIHIITHKQLPNTRKAPTNPPRFSNFIKKVIVELKRDEVLYPEGNVIEVRFLSGFTQAKILTKFAETVEQTTW